MVDHSVVGRSLAPVTAHVESGRLRFFRETLRLLPAPGPNRNYYNMFRWGAQTNLGLLHEAKGKTGSAIAYFAGPDPTFQHHGNLLRGRELIWRNPTADVPAPLPLAPSGLDEGPRP